MSGPRRKLAGAAVQVAGRKVTNKPLPYRPPMKSALLKQSPVVSEKQPFRKAPWIIGGLAVYSFTAYGVYLYKSYQAAIIYSKDLRVPFDVADRYDSTADHYDSDLDTMELFMGMGWLRTKLVSQAKGDVLEVSVGTGRNSKYYNLNQIDSIICVDTSTNMLVKAKSKFEGIHPTYRDIKFVNRDASDTMPSPPEGYDSIIQTFGLCSTSQPVRLLENLGQLCKAGDGQILLLEHGRSHYNWVNRILDNLAAIHADRHGCWWNRDIQQLVDESGLETVQMKRYHLGTTWFIELRPRRGSRPPASQASKS